jgi:hypothetical protein
MGRSGTRVVDESRTTNTVTGLGRDEFDAVVEFAHNAGVNISVWPHGSSKYAYSYTVDEPSKPPFDSARGFAKNVSASICGMYSDAEVKTARARMHQAENEAIASSLRRYADSLDRRGVESPDPSCIERGKDQLIAAASRCYGDIVTKTYEDWFGKHYDSDDASTCKRGAL